MDVYSYQRICMLSGRNQARQQKGIRNFNLSIARRTTQCIEIKA